MQRIQLSSCFSLLGTCNILHCHSIVHFRRGSCSTHRRRSHGRDGRRSKRCCRSWHEGGWWCWRRWGHRTHHRGRRGYSRSGSWLAREGRKPSLFTHRIWCIWSCISRGGSSNGSGRSRSRSNCLHMKNKNIFQPSSKMD